jgi:hypothetical protein
MKDQRRGSLQRTTASGGLRLLLLEGPMMMASCLLCLVPVPVYPSFTYQKVPYLTFTCLQGSVWRINTAGRCQQEIRFCGRRNTTPAAAKERARFLPSRGPTKLSHAWRYAERPSTTVRASTCKALSRKSPGRIWRGLDRESRATAVGRLRGAPVSVSLPGIRNASA